MFANYAQQFSREGDTRIARSAATGRASSTPDFEVTDAMVAEFKELVQQSRRARSTRRRWTAGPRVHQGDDPLRDRRRPVRRGRRRTQNLVTARSAGAVRAERCSREAEKLLELSRQTPARRAAR